MVELGRLLAPHGIAVELIGQADAAARAHIGGRPRIRELARLRAQRRGPTPGRGRARRALPTPGRGELPPLDAHQGRRIHGAWGTRRDHAPAARRGTRVGGRRWLSSSGSNDPQAGGRSGPEARTPTPACVRRWACAFHEYALPQPRLAPARLSLRRPAGGIGPASPSPTMPGAAGRTESASAAAQALRW